MHTRLDLAPSSLEARAIGSRHFSFHRALAIGAAFGLWAVIVMGFKLLTI